MYVPTMNWALLVGTSALFKFPKGLVAGTSELRLIQVATVDAGFLLHSCKVSTDGSFVLSSYFNTDISSNTDKTLFSAQIFF